MSKAVLISIRPEWCQLIANGEKTIEVRKTRPRLDTPFECYIYCTLPKYPHEDFICTDYQSPPFYGGGKVIGKFTCDRIYELEAEKCPGGSYHAKGQDRATTNMIARQSCLDIKEMHDYLHGKKGYAWHISNLVLYDTPKKLECFRKLCPEELGCESCAMYTENADSCGNEALRLHRAPQSWQYVRDTKNEQK